MARNRPITGIGAGGPQSCDGGRMKTLVHRSPDMATSDRQLQEASLLARAAQRLRRRGRAGDHELARLLERALLSVRAGAGEADTQVLTALEIVRESGLRRSR